MYLELPTLQELLMKDSQQAVLRVARYLRYNVVSKLEVRFLHQKVFIVKLN